MLNPKLSSKLTYPEYQILYDLGFRITDPAIKLAIQSNVQLVRRGVRSKVDDQLLSKLKKFGNGGGWAKFKAKELEKVIFDESKGPPDNFKGLWRSIEFETIFISQKALDDFIYAIRAKGLTKFVTVKDDNSLRTDDDDKVALRKEIVVTYKSGEEDILRFVCAQMDSPTLRQQNVTHDGRPTGRAYVNNTCGAHVHFDMRVVPGAANPAEAEKLVKQYGARLARCVPALKMILPKSRRNNQFCLNAINDMGKKELNDPHHIDKERYAFVNLKSYRRHETIEVRGHSGTLNAEKLLNWIALCEKIMTTRIRFRSDTHEIRNPLDLIKIYKLDNVLAEYIQERLIKFNTAREREMFAVPAPREAQAGKIEKVSFGIEEQ